MMTRFSIGFFIICSLLCCKDDKCVSNSEFENDIDQGLKYALSHGNTVNFSEIADFEWDNMYVLRPYSITNEFEKLSGIKDNCLNIIGIDMRDNINLVVFTKGDQLVSYVEYPGGKADFIVDQSPKRYNRDNAVFNLVKEREKPILAGKDLIVIRNL